MADDTTYTQEQVDALLEEKLAAAKAEGDTAFQKLWDEAKAAKAKAKAFEGMDPDEVRAALDRLGELEREGKAKAAGITAKELERLRAEARDELEAEYREFKERAEQLAKENRGLKLDAVVKKQMAEHGVRGERVDALFKLTRDAWDLTDDGEPMLANRPGGKIDRYITDELAKEYPEFFEGSGSSGGGASRSAAGGGGGSRSVAADDGAAFMANLEDIAQGKVGVR